MINKLGAAGAFDHALQGITDQRSADYGHPADNFRRVQQMVHVLRECDDPELREALEMIVRKVVRLIENPRHLDSWIDIAGYARCAAMIIDRREEDRG
jgi:hypothetical protein